MRRSVVLGVAVAGAAVAIVLAIVLAHGRGTGAAPASADAGAVLQTSDHSGGCVLVDPGTLRCANRRTQARPEPVAIEIGGKSSPHAVTATVDWSSGKVLANGSSEDLGAFRCSEAAARLTCFGPSGNGLAVSARYLAAVVPGAHYP